MERCSIALKCHSLERHFAVEVLLYPGGVLFLMVCVLLCYKHQEQHGCSSFSFWVIVGVLRHFVALSAVFCARVSVFLPGGCGDGCGWAELGLVCSLSCAVGRFCLSKSTVGLSVCQNWTVRWSSGLILLSTVTSPHLQHILFLQSLWVCPQNLNTTIINTYTTVQKLWNQ